MNLHELATSNVTAASFINPARVLRICDIAQQHLPVLARECDRLVESADAFVAQPRTTCA